MTYADQLRELIRAELRARSVTQDELARRVGISAVHVSRTLTGLSGLSMDLAERMLAELGAGLLPPAITGGAEPKPAPPPKVRVRAKGYIVTCDACGLVGTNRQHSNALERRERHLEDEHGGEL